MHGNVASFCSRGFVEAILLNTMTELANHRTFDSLVRAVSAVKEEKLSQQKIIQKLVPLKTMLLV